MRRSAKNKAKISEPVKKIDPPDYTGPLTAAAVTQLVAAKTRVLLLGCTSNYLAQMLHEQGCQVIAVGAETAIVDQIAAYCERILVDNLPEADLGQGFCGSQFDVTIAENLDLRQDFHMVLRTGKQYLKPDGYVVASIMDDSHNRDQKNGSISRISYGAGEGDFSQFADVHLHKSIKKVFAEAGLTVVYIERLQSDANVSATIVVSYPIPQAVADLLRKYIDISYIESEAVQREVVRLQQSLAELQKTVRQQAHYLDALEIVAGKVEHFLEHESRLRAIQLNTNNQLLQRMEQIFTMLAPTEQHEQLPQLVPQNSIPSLLPEVSQQRAATLVTRTERQTRDSRRSNKQPPNYQQQVNKIRSIADSVLPPNCIVAVVSKGDDDLLQLGVRQGVHFPQTDNGAYAGFHPADSVAAISHLEAVRTRGSHFLMLPNTAYWWLEHYKEFSAHLDTRYRQVWKDEHCIIYQLMG